MLIRNCKNCEQPFEVAYPSSGRTFCTAKCRASNRKPRSDRGLRRSNWVSTQCPCGKSFECPPWQAEQNTYCSKDCVRKYARPAGERGGGRPPILDQPNYSRDGYKLIYLPKNQMPTGYRGHRYPEHRWVMMQKLGRELLPGENVHHINGVRDDNRPENLELWITSQPRGQRITDALSWAREIISRYGD